MEHLFIAYYKQGSDEHFEFAFDRIMFPLRFISGSRIHSFSLQTAQVPSGKDPASLHSQQMEVRVPFY